jgi:hypothetical protein
MSQEENKPKNTPIIPIEKSIRIEEIKNRSEKIGDILIKGERQYAKPFINEIIQPTTNPVNPPQKPNTNDSAE